MMRDEQLRCCDQWCQKQLRGQEDKDRIFRGEVCEISDLLFPSQLTIQSLIYLSDTVKCFKLRGINISDDLCRNAHVLYVQKWRSDYLSIIIRKGSV